MGKESTVGKMEILIEVNFKKINATDQAYTNGKMVASTEENGEAIE